MLSSFFLKKHVFTLKKNTNHSEVLEKILKSTEYYQNTVFKRQLILCAGTDIFSQEKEQLSPRCLKLRNLFEKMQLDDDEEDEDDEDDETHGNWTIICQ